MWYMLKCLSGEEKEVFSVCRQYLSEQRGKEVFVFTYDKMKRYEGKWHVESTPMFPQYIFVELEHNDRSVYELRFLDNIGKMKERKNWMQALPVSSIEEAFLRRLFGDGHHLSMSKGIIQNGIPHVTEGPLKGMEEQIIRIDRHKRLARIRVGVGQAALTAGLEIVEKS